MSQAESKKKTIINMIVVILVFAIVFSLVYLLEQDHILKSAIMDDPGVREYYYGSGGSLFKGGYKFRPIGNLLCLIGAYLSVDNILIYGYYNLVLQSVIASFLFFSVKKICNSVLLPSCITALYVASRFSYYQITQVYGVIEAGATLFGLIFLVSMIYYIRTKKAESFYVGLGAFFLASMAHERYAVLFVPMLYAAIVTIDFKDKEKLIKHKLIKPVAVLGMGAVVALLLYFKTNNVMMGTGGQPVTTGFSIAGVIEHVLRCFRYIFDIQNDAGNVYLIMCVWDSYSDLVKTCVIIMISALCVIVLIYLYNLIRMSKEERVESIKCILLILMTVIMIVGIISTTIRVELRWVYYPFIVIMIGAAYICTQGGRILRGIKKVLFLAIAVCSVISNLYMRDYYDRLYYWGDYLKGNAFYEQTFDKYGYDMYNYNWIVVWPGAASVSIGDFFDEYDIRNQYEMNLIDCSDAREVDADVIDSETKVLFFDSEPIGFSSESDNRNEIFIREGIWDDWWCAAESSMVVSTGLLGQICLSVYYPEFEEGRACSLYISIDGGEPIKYDLTGIDTEMVLDAGRCKLVNVDIKTDFIINNKGEDVRALSWQLSDVRGR